MSAKRPGFTLFQLLVVLAVLALLFALFLPAIAKIRLSAARIESQNNLRQMALACHNYHDVYAMLPPGVDAKGFSTASQLLPYLEQANLWQQIDFKKSVDDKDNQKVAAVIVKVFLDPMDPVTQVDKDFGSTNYLFCAGSQYDLKDNDGVFFRRSQVKLTDVSDGTSNTLMIGQTLKGDGAAKATDVHRQHVRLTKDDLKKLGDDSGVKDWKDDKNIAADRCKSWMDGRFLQGTFTATRVLNDEKPDVDCGGAGGLSGLRGVTDGTNIALCDGSVRFVTAKIKLDTWKLLANKADGQPIPDF
jgi:Tfp pilus assembly protein PilE